MKSLAIALILTPVYVGFNGDQIREKSRNEILQAERSFEKMALEKGIAEAFYYYADENAVIKRENDTLICGKENIRNYYARKNLNNVVLNWYPDFIEVSGNGDLGYTYGKYSWKVTNKEGDVSEYKGVFHTVWKKMPDNSWKYVWD